MADRQRPTTRTRVVVIGLGRFGGALARELARRGHEILGVDADPRRVQALADDLTNCVVADTTDEEALRQLDVPGFERAVVGIGTNLEASILTTSLLVDFGIPKIWAKALNQQQARILERVGAHHVVRPEHDMGMRVAHLVTGRMLDFIEFDDDYAIVKTTVPREADGLPLGQSRLRSKYDVTVVGVKRPGEGFTYATAETVVHRGDVMIVAGKTAAVERVADLD
ncbi:potassium channel family protein [Kribbella sindirgiensis]|uniref:potassium channel family protein n=1 Tax=Kribbella sindirgiensis TaxID=1124744 RepID=UPI00192D3A7C|nr:TrkA family potassium uptake protein [Kribbella sindirgiensis]